MMWLPLVLLTGCGQWIVDFQDPHAPCDFLGAEPQTVMWIDAPMVSPAPIPVEVSHACDAPARISLSVDGGPGSLGFSASPGQLVLEPGQRGTVEVHFDPDGYANASGSLVLDAGGRTLPLPLVGLVYGDQDDDLHHAVEAGGLDCDDFDPAVNPTAAEVRNARDDDCDGLADEGWLAPGDLLITELWVWESPWVEVRNTTDQAIELAGWALETADGTRSTVRPTRVEPGAHGVLALDLPLDPDADVLTLWLGDQPLAAVRWDASRSVAEGASLSLDPDLESRWGDAASWCASTPATPGRANTPCPPRDVDGDQFTVEDGDCDDSDPDIHPGTTEEWDWVDQDCNGAVDDAQVVRVASGWVDAGAVSVFNDDWLPTADLDGDGVEVLFRVFSEGSTWILAVEGADVDGADVGYDELAEVRIELEESPALSHYSFSPGVDLDGDGLDELLAHQSNGSIYLIPGASLGEEATQDDASLQVLKGERAPWPGALGPDLDGDGAGELVVFSKRDVSDPDELHLFEVDQGTVELDDAALTLTLGHTTAVAGATIRGDWTGDGVDDLATCVGSPGHGYQVLILEGGPELLEAELLASVTHARVQGCSPDLRPVAADLDGDGQVDLAVADQGTTSTSVLAFLDTPSLGGAVRPGSADVTLEGDPPSRYFATSVDAGDLDGDGAAELVVGSRPGAVHVFCGDGLADGTTADACRSLDEPGTGAPWALGAAVSAADLDGDGLGDVSALAPEFGGGGRVWFVLSGGAP